MARWSIYVRSPMFLKADQKLISAKLDELTAAQLCAGQCCATHNCADLALTPPALCKLRLLPEF